MIVMNPFLFKPDYELDLDGFIGTRDWENTTPDDLIIYVVVNVSEKENETKITANLMGPLIINQKNKEVIQAVISDTTYSHQHNVLTSS